jgi:hypothetical protein
MGRTGIVPRRHHGPGSAEPWGGRGRRTAHRSGLFVDEVGKFITQKNDYFLPLAAPIVYASLLLILVPSSLNARVRDQRYDQGDGITLADVVANSEPTMLIGTSTQSAAFSEQIVKQMASKVERPIIMPLSNPTSRSACRAIDSSRTAWSPNSCPCGLAGEQIRLIEGRHDPDRSLLINY